MGKGIFGTLHGFFEGGDIYGRRVANAGFMRALLTADPFDEYHAFVPDPEGQRRVMEAYGGIPAVARGAVRIFGRQGLAQALKATDFYCFHLSDPISNQPGLAVLRNALAPRLFPITSVTHSINYIGYAQGFLNQIWPGVTPRDAIGATSRAAAAVLRGYFAQLRHGYSLPDSWGQPAIEIIPLGVDCRVFQPPSAETRARARARYCPGDGVLCLAHGRIALDDKMDVMPLLFALRRVREERGEGAAVGLVLSGRGRRGDHYPEALLTAAKAMRVPMSIVDSPSAGELADLYAAADIFVSPSDNLQETFGLTMLEAAAVGLPVVASDWDGYRDLVRDGVTGLLVPTLMAEETPGLDIVAHCLPDNIHQLFRAQQTVVDVPALAHALAILAGDAGLRHRMGEAGRLRVMAEFDWPVVMRRWLAYWDELWRIAISGVDEARLRAARHPGVLDFPRLFGAHPSALLRPDSKLRLRLTPRGEMVRAGREFSVLWQGLEFCMKDMDIRRMLVLARRPIAVHALLSRLRTAGGTAEAAQFALLWAMKNDLLERASQD